MRAYRKRPWSAMAINMTPLIDVVFLIIIFFIIMINFSEMHIRKVNLPKADETRNSLADKRATLSVLIKLDNMIFLDRIKVRLEDLGDLLRARNGITRNNLTIKILADENVPYKVVKDVMHKISLAGIRKIEFSTLKGPSGPLQEE